MILVSGLLRVLAPDEIEVARVDEDARSLTEDEDRIAAVEGIDKQRQSPPMEKNQNDMGMTLSFRFSEAIHWTRNRMEKNACPTNPTDSQRFSYSSRPLVKEAVTASP